jgi:hypothetical protein
MFRVLLVAFVLIFSNFVHADNEVSVRGPRARRLTNTLSSSGAYSDCGAGTCELSVQNIQCLMTGNSVGRRHYNCTFLGSTEAGETVEIKISNKAAKSLYLIFEKSGLEGDCGAGTCGIEAKSVNCTLSGNSVGHPRYFCAISKT